MYATSHERMRQHTVRTTEGCIRRLPNQRRATLNRRAIAESAGVR